VRDAAQAVQALPRPSNGDICRGVRVPPLLSLSVLLHDRAQEEIIEKDDAHNNNQDGALSNGEPLPDAFRELHKEFNDMRAGMESLFRGFGFDLGPRGFGDRPGGDSGGGGRGDRSGGGFGGWPFETRPPPRPPREPMPQAAPGVKIEEI